MNYGLRDEFFAEVRFRILRAVAELGLVNITSRQVLESRSWDRGNLILLLGALRDGKAIHSLATIIKNTKQPMKFREMAIRSLVFIGASQLPMETPAGEITPIAEWMPAYPSGIWRKAWPAVPKEYKVSMWPPPRDPEIEALLPRASRRFSFGPLMDTKRLTRDQFHPAADALSSVLSNRHETVSLRIAALRALKGFVTDTDKVVDAVKGLLLDEWENFGQDAIDVLIKIRNETSISALHDFALNDKADKCLQLECIIGLAKTGKPSALTALREISKKDPDDVICAAACKAANKFNERNKWLSSPRAMVAHGWLGVAGLDVTPELKEEFNLKDEKGAFVREVIAGSPADKAGIEKGDVIVIFDGKDIERMEDLICTVALTSAGKKVLSTIIRKGKTRNVEVKIGKPQENN